MHIVMITHYFPDHGGGIEVVTGNLTREMARHDDIHIKWFASDSDRLPRSVNHVQAIPVPASNFVEKKSGLPYPLWNPTAWKLIWDEIKACDVVHIHDYIYFGSLLAWLFAKILGRPCVVTQHVGNIPFTNAILRSTLKLSNLLIGRTILRLSEATVFVSDVVRKTFFKNPKDNIYLIPNGVDTTIFYQTDKDDRIRSRKKLGYDEDDSIALFVGRFVTKKGLPLLKEIAAQNAYIKWIFAGHGTIQPEDWANERVSVIRNRSGKDLAELYQISDALVLPSIGEGFPLVIQESLACGTPVLTSSDLKNSLTDIEQIIEFEDVHDGDAVSRWNLHLSDLIARSKSHSIDHSALANSALERWSWSICAKSYIDIYRKCCSKP